MQLALRHIKKNEIKKNKLSLRINKRKSGWNYYRTLYNLPHLQILQFNLNKDHRKYISESIQLLRGKNPEIYLA